MRAFCFDDSAGREISNYGSENVILAWIAHLAGRAHISCMHIGPKGVVGYHQAAIPQLFLVVQGEGWMGGKTTERYRIRGGQAVYWEKAEWHESGTDTGMVGTTQGKGSRSGYFRGGLWIT